MSVTVPRVFGVEMTVRTPGETQCTARFGMLEVGLAYIGNRDGTVCGTVVWWIGEQRYGHSFNDGSERTVAKAVAAIERELLAIRAAIPALDHEPLKAHGMVATYDTYVAANPDTGDRARIVATVPADSRAESKPTTAELLDKATREIILYMLDRGPVAPSGELRYFVRAVLSELVKP